VRKNVWEAGMGMGKVWLRQERQLVPAAGGDGKGKGKEREGARSWRDEWKQGEGIRGRIRRIEREREDHGGGGDKGARPHRVSTEE